MSEISTAESFLKNYENDTNHYADQEYSTNKLIEGLKEFAKRHVIAALKEASKQASIHCDTYGQVPTITKEAILNAYPLENIK
jgi:hypothetical protein